MKKFMFNDIDFTNLATSTCLYGSSFQLSELAKESKNVRNNLQAREKITFLQNKIACQYHG
jgi:hypothetical protein